MKVSDLRRKLAATLAACGMLGPGVAFAANLNTNLVVNGGMENVDLTTIGYYNGPKILDWTVAGGLTAFAYSHAGSGGQGSDFANGGPLANGGQYYFSPGNVQDSAGDAAVISAPGQFYQDLDVSTGPAATLIATGTASYKLSAYFSSYVGQGDFGNAQIDFLNASSTSLGTATLADGDTTTWGQDFIGGIIPVGTQKVRLSLYGVALAGSPDGYTDNVDFQVTNELIEPFLGLRVDRDTGGLAIINRTGGPITFSGYSITSAFEGMAPAGWLSIADNYDAGNPGLNQFDAAHQWTKLTDPATRTDLSEADLAASDGATLGHTKSINLSNAGGWIRNPHEDLVFQYVSGGQVKTGPVTFVDNGGQPFESGDLNTDGSITSADWMVLRANQHTNLANKSLAEAYRLGDMNGDKLNNFTDFAAFKAAYEDFNGPGSFAAMLASAPEPGSASLLAAAALAAVPAMRRKNAAAP